jgi:hypothetical protein
MLRSTFSCWKTLNIKSSLQVWNCFQSLKFILNVLFEFSRHIIINTHSYNMIKYNDSHIATIVQRTTNICTMGNWPTSLEKIKKLTSLAHIYVSSDVCPMVDNKTTIKKLLFHKSTNVVPIPGLESFINPSCHMEACPSYDEVASTSAKLPC